MTEEQMNAYRKVFEEDKKRRKEQNQKECSQSKIAHQDEKIAHPDVMRKTPAIIWLILGMVGSLIFQQWFLAWPLLLWWYFSKDRV